MMDTSTKRKICLLVGLVGCCGLAIILSISSSPPGDEDTYVEPDGQSDHHVTPPIGSLELFQMKWDSESRFDWPVVEPLAMMSQSAYDEQTTAAAAFQNLGFERVVPIVVGSMTAYVASSKNVMVIVFRGTDDSDDWLVNLDTDPARTRHGQIHEGFAKAYDSLESPIIQEIRARKPTYVWATGHSLGGALALVCAYDLVAQENIALYGVITFGQPMVAGKELAGFLNGRLSGRYAHIVNDADIVPRVPPGYSHCGSLVWFTRDGVRRSEPKHLVGAAPGANEPPSAQYDDLTPLSNAEFRELKANLRKQQNAKPKLGPDGKPLCEGNLPFIRDHAMNLYLEKIRGVLHSTNSK